MRTIIFAGIFTLLFGLRPIIAQGLTSANQAYERGDYRTAIMLYEQLLTEHKPSTNLLYNLGNAYYKEGKIGKAILNYERSLKLDPGFEPAQKNITFIKDQMDYPFSGIPEFFLKRWWDQLVLLFPISTWTWLHLFSLFLGVLGISFWLFSNQIEIKKRGFFGGIGSLLFAFLFFILADQRKTHQLDSGEGIVLLNDVFLKVAPDEDSPDVIKLSEGVKVFIEDELNDWYKIYLEDREPGWIMKDWIEVI